MTGESDPQRALSAEQLARTILEKVEFAEHSDEEAARNALREIAALCQRALEPTGSTSEATT